MSTPATPAETKAAARPELLEATDAQIDDAVSYADPMALRGLLYQLTGEEALASTRVTPQAGIDPARFVGESDVALVRTQAASFLKAYRDAGAPPIDIGPAERLVRSMALAAVTDGIERITRTGIRTQVGTERQLDVIIYATGFKANECLWPMEVSGRGGRSVEELWAKDGPRAYLGAMAPGFPNFFMIYGPNMNPYGGLGVINHEEMVTRFALECVEYLILNAEHSVDVTEEAYWRGNGEFDEREKSRIYMDPRAKSYYQNEHGCSATNCPFYGTEMWHWLRRPNFDDLIIQ